MPLLTSQTILEFDMSWSNPTKKYWAMHWCKLGNWTINSMWFKSILMSYKLTVDSLWTTTLISDHPLIFPFYFPYQSVKDSLIRDHSCKWLQPSVVLKFLKFSLFSLNIILGKFYLALTILIFQWLCYIYCIMSIP